MGSVVPHLSPPVARQLATTAADRDGGVDQSTIGPVTISIVFAGEDDE
jgi:hypothetical protein